MILAVYAALERIPHSYLEASVAVDARSTMTLRAVWLQLARPGVVGTSIVSLHLQPVDFMRPLLAGGVDMQQALCVSLKAGVDAPAVAVALGSMAAFGGLRVRFFGRETVSFLLVLPIALPGIITGMALNSFFVFWKTNFGLWTIVIGH